MAATNLYKGNVIGDSKQKGLFSKLGETDLKSLNYQDFLPGIDRAPYVTHDINTGEPTERDSWWKLYQNTSELAVQRRIEDVKRLTKFIASPKGVLWESRVAGLETIQKDLYNQSTNTRTLIKASGSKYGVGNYGVSGSNVNDSSWSWNRVLQTLGNVGKSILQDVGITAATLEQAGVSGTGTHVDTFISRAYLNDGDSKMLGKILSYAGITDGGKLNAAAKAQKGQEILGDDPWTKLDPDKALYSNVEAFDNGVAKGEKVYGDQKLTGAGSYYKKSEGPAVKFDRTTGTFVQDLQTTLENIVRDSTNKNLGISSDKNSPKPNRVETGVNSTVRDLDKKQIGDSYGKFIEKESYQVSKNVSIDAEGETAKIFPKSSVTIKVPKLSSEENTTDGVGPFGEKSGLTKGLGEYFYTRPRKKDTVYSYVVDSDPDLEFKFGNLDRALGLIPFCITTITPDHRTYLNFPAYLESYDDNYNADWESVKYVGRAENFYGYKGYTRSINLSFKVIAFRESHLVPLYQELNKLVGVTAPSYDNVQNLFMRGTLASLTVGELLRDKKGIIPSVKLSWERDDPWEVVAHSKYEENSQTADFGFNTIDKKATIQVPHVLTVVLQFTPIEQEEVREDYGAYFVFDPDERPTVKNTASDQSNKYGNNTTEQSGIYPGSAGIPDTEEGWEIYKGIVPGTDKSDPTLGRDVKIYEA